MGLCPHSSKNFKSFCCCLPLALATLIISLCFIGWGGYEAWNATQASNWPKFEAVLSLIVSLIKVLFGVCGLFAVLFKWSAGANILAGGFKILIWSFVAIFIVQWVVWILQMCGLYNTEDGEKWKPTSQDVKEKIVPFTVLYVAFFVFAWWLLSCFRSFAMILKYGGTGWEKKGYKTLRTELHGDRGASDLPV